MHLCSGPGLLSTMHCGAHLCPPCKRVCVSREGHVSPLMPMSSLRITREEAKLHTGEALRVLILRLTRPRLERSHLNTLGRKLGRDRSMSAEQTIFVCSEIYLLGRNTVSHHLQLFAQDAFVLSRSSWRQNHMELPRFVHTLPC